MKGKTKTQKGITLVALIITIVVLLILAVVAITAIQDEDLIGKANSAVTTYNQSVVNETEQLGNNADYLDSYLPKNYEVYEIGQVVRVKNTATNLYESFYVLADGGKSSSTVTLLAKEPIAADMYTAGELLTPLRQYSENSGVEQGSMYFYPNNTKANLYAANLGGTGRLPVLSDFQGVDPDDIKSVEGEDYPFMIDENPTAAEVSAIDPSGKLNGMITWENKEGRFESALRPVVIISKDLIVK